MPTVNSSDNKKGCCSKGNDQNNSNVRAKAQKNNKNNSNASKKKKNNAEGFHENGAQVHHRSTHNIGFLPPGVAHREQVYHAHNTSKRKNEQHALHDQFNDRQEALELFSNRFDENVPIPRRLNRVSASLVEAVNDFHFAMMNDKPRNEFYYELLKSAIIPGKSGVLEIGAGSGLLSMMAAKLGAKWVVAVEGAPEMAHLAQENICANNLSDRITVLNMLSTELTPKDLPAQPDILVSEIFGTLLLGESAHDYIADVKRRLLSPSTLILPGRGVQYAVPIECPHLESICSVNSWRGINLSHVMALQDTVSVVFTKQYGFRMSSVPYKILAEPVKILEVDFNSGAMIYGEASTSSTTSKVSTKCKNKSHEKKQEQQKTFDVCTTATSSGVAHAWLFYWNVYNNTDTKRKEEKEIVCERSSIEIDSANTNNNNNKKNDNNDEDVDANEENTIIEERKEREVIDNTTASAVISTVNAEQTSNNNDKEVDSKHNKYENANENNDKNNVNHDKQHNAHEQHNQELVMSTAPWETANNFARDMQWGQALQLIDANCSNLLWHDSNNNKKNMSTESLNNCTAHNDMPQQLCMTQGNNYHFRCTLSSDNVLIHLQYLNNTDVEHKKQ